MLFFAFWSTRELRTHLGRAVKGDSNPNTANYMKKSPLKMERAPEKLMEEFVVIAAVVREMTLKVLRSTAKG